ncbi:hypothetical protein P0136_08775 [Lentisphaerota bacterium ZTH]|nr:hypothetical protein JYG24_00120 [Lentisphaerota bacterium]WET05457.1 hypothetical protein P0136_08775 [Lentisphaerota bacterium ZTH]
MNKNLLAVFIFLVSLIATQVSGQVLVGRDFWDRSSEDYDDYTRCFTQWSLSPTWSVSARQGFWYHDDPFLNYRYSFMPEVPFIAKYGEEYKFRNKILVITASSDMLEIAPRNLRQGIIPNINQFQNIGEVIAIADLRCFVTAVITGKGTHPDTETLVGKEFNIGYHGLLAWYNSHVNEHPDIVTFSRDLPMGMFVPKGILAASAETFPMERISNVHVSCHRVDDNPHPHISPDNARFVPIAEISSFWTVAKIGDNGENIYVTYHLLCNTPRSSDAVRRAVYENDDFNVMLTAVKQVGEDLNLDEFSKGVLRDWVENIVHVSRPFNAHQDPFSPTEEPPKLAHENYHGFNVVEYRGKFYGIQQDQGAFYMSKIENGDYNVSFDGNSLEAVQARITDYVTPKLDFENYHAFNIIEYMGGFYGILQNEGAFDINRIMNGGYSASFAGNSQAQVRERIDDHLN